MFGKQKKADGKGGPGKAAADAPARVRGDAGSDLMRRQERYEIYRDRMDRALRHICLFGILCAVQAVAVLGLVLAKPDPDLYLTNYDLGVLPLQTWTDGPRVFGEPPADDSPAVEMPPVVNGTAPPPSIR